MGASTASETEIDGSLVVMPVDGSYRRLGLLAPLTVPDSRGRGPGYLPHFAGSGDARFRVAGVQLYVRCSRPSWRRDVAAFVLKTMRDLTCVPVAEKK